MRWGDRGFPQLEGDLPLAKRGWHRAGSLGRVTAVRGGGPLSTYSFRSNGSSYKQNEAATELLQQMATYDGAGARLCWLPGLVALRGTVSVNHFAPTRGGTLPLR